MTRQSVVLIGAGSVTFTQVLTADFARLAPVRPAGWPPPVNDNAEELPASVPTFVHHLRRAGYRTILSGKMHFVGPDQLHGFEDRLTTDIYPADFLWTKTRGSQGDPPRRGAPPGRRRWTAPAPGGATTRR